MGDESLLTVKEFADRLGLSSSTVYYLVRQNICRCIRLSERVMRFEPCEVDRLIKRWGTKSVIIPKGEDNA